MGRLIDGVWTDVPRRRTRGGAWSAEESGFRHWVTPDGAPGPSGEGGFPAETGRYHLYVSWACPFAHRTLILRRLKGLEDAVSVSVAHPHMLENGWEYREADGATVDHVNGCDYQHRIYTLADPRYTGKASVPVLWDRERRTIVNNESSEILRMFNSAFDAITGDSQDFCPPALRGGIDAVNETVFRDVNTGVYRCGFAGTQEAYEEAFRRLFATLDDLERRLSGARYLVGDRLTEADWRLFTTLVRFDVVYHGHFKANLRRIADYPSLSGYLRDLYQYPGVAETVRFDHIKQHYYVSHGDVNPTRIVPLGPEVDLDAPHERDRFADRRATSR